MSNGSRNLRLPVLILLAVVAPGCAGSRAGGNSSAADGPAGTPGAVGTASVSEASLESELYRLIVNQRAYFEEEGSFAGDLDDLDFTPGPGVQLELLQGGETGFSAIATSGTAECAVFSGDVRAPRGYVSIPETPACRN